LVANYTIKYESQLPSAISKYKQARKDAKTFTQLAFASLREQYLPGDNGILQNETGDCFE